MILDKTSLKFPAFMYEVVKLSDRQHYCSSASQKNWSMMHGTNNVLTEFLAAEKDSFRNNHKCLYNIYGCAMVDRSTIGHWVKRVTVFKRGKQSSMICLTQEVSSQLSVLYCCSMLMPLFVRIDASQPNIWH